MKPEVTLRQARKDDALAISTLYQNVYEGTYPDPMMKDLRLMKGVLSSPEYCWTVGDAGGEIVASTVFRIDLKNRLAKAFGAVVDPSYRGHKLTQRLMVFGYEHMRSQAAELEGGVEIIYATTRTISIEPQKLTSNLGYKKLGVFPNVHKTASYETHCLTAFFSPESLEKRFSDFALHPKLNSIYEIVSRECGLPPLPLAPLPSPKSANGEYPLKLEAITAPLFVRHRFLDEKPTEDDHEWFFPFQEPNILITTPDQSVEIFAFLSEADKHCVLIGVRDGENIGMPRIMAAATRVLKDLGTRYIEFVIRADETEKIQAAFESQYIPSAYFPAMQLSHGKRFDFIVFSRSFEILDFHGAHLEGINLEYLRLYFQSWQELALAPILNKQKLENSPGESGFMKLLDSDPFDVSGAATELFLESFRETAAKHYANNSVFRSFWQEAGLKPSDVTSEAILEKTPPLMVHVFKEWDLCSVPRSEIVLRLTSSGTGGQKSQMLLNQGSLDRVKFLAYRIHEALGITSPGDEVNYVCFTYDPKVAKDLGTAFTDELLTSFTGVNEVYYTFQWSEAKNDFVFDEKGLVETLRRFQRDSKPVRLLGFPAFIYKVLKENDLRFEFGPRSWVQTGGGWKGLADQEIPKEEFRAFVSSRLGIPPENVRDLFGMVEHGIPYVDCRRGRMHIPNFARVLIRSPFDLGVLPAGETGLIQFLCTYNDSYPAMNILSTDWGRLGHCDCGMKSMTLEIRGRAGVTKHKGCAIHALEALA